MADTGVKNPGTMANVDNGGAAWSNPNNAKVSNNTYADVVLLNEKSDYLVASNFGFNIPINAIIDGIDIEYEGKTDNGELGTAFWTGITKDATDSGQYAGWQIISPSLNPIERYYKIGNGKYLWGTAWTPAEINDSKFGAILYKIHEGSFDDTLYIDHIRVTVFYTTVSPFPSFNR